VSQSLSHEKKGEKIIKKIKRIYPLPEKSALCALSEAHAKDTTPITLQLTLEHIPRDAIIAQNRSKRATILRARAARAFRTQL
jgi:Zn-dependent oligopeptidase